MSNVVLIGGQMEKQDVVGPFDSFSDADDWCCKNLSNGQFTWIITLFSPEEYKEE